MLAATRAGIGICVLAQSRVPQDLRVLSGRFGLPPLADVEMALIANPRSAGRPDRGAQQVDLEPAPGAVAPLTPPPGIRHVASSSPLDSVIFVAAAVISSTVLRLPAAALGQESPLPAFHSLQRLPDSSRSPGIPDDMRRRIDWGRLDAPLPYRLQADYELEHVMMDVPAVSLANDRVEAVVLPQYGGRIWSLRQLSSGRDLVYRNPVLSWANLGLTNAWFAGGVEWNLGSTGHSATTARPLFAAPVDTAYGPVLRLWEWERTRDLVFSVDLSLPAGSDFLYASVRVRNPDGWVKPLYWWTNVAVAETPGVRVVAPASQAWRTTYDGALASVAMPQPERCRSGCVLPRSRWAPSGLLLPDRGAAAQVDCGCGH